MEKRSALFVLILLVVFGIAGYFSLVNPITRYIPQGLDLQGGVYVVLRARGPASLAEMKKVETILSYRVNHLGVSEPVIQRQGNTQIVVELPGVKNQAQAIATLGKMAQLAFKGPHGHLILTGADLQSAQASYGAGNVPIVQLQFTPKGTALFAAATTRLLNQNISIYLDNHLVESPTVRSAITTGQAQISGGFATIKDAQSLASLLNSGALPVPLQILEVRQVSPTLGQASVRASEIAVGIAMVLIILAMVVLYRFAGFLADVALVIYLFLLLGALIGIHAVLTLPGVAGIVLSAGIAVDANVIIFARIRDELAQGRKVGAAIEHGFKNALRAIMDSNVSTLVAAAMLYYFGTGEVRGFAVTLGLGVLISLITAVFVTRYMVRLLERTPLVRHTFFFVGFRGVKTDA